MHCTSTHRLLEYCCIIDAEAISHPGGAYGPYAPPGWEIASASMMQQYSSNLCVDVQCMSPVCGEMPTTRHQAVCQPSSGFYEAPYEKRPAKHEPREKKP